MRRAFEFVAALILAVGLAPVIGVIALAIRLSSRGPVFYRAARIGYQGRPFTMVKFRTMRQNSGGPGITRRADPRVTPVGRFLRRTKLDEIPQLFNIMAGEMSFVGPRPEVEEYVEMYSPEQREVLSVRPGLTSVASLAFSDEENQLGDDWRDRYIREIMPAKLRMDIEYLRTRRLTSDLRVLWDTLVLLFKSRAGKGSSGAVRR